MNLAGRIRIIVTIMVVLALALSFGCSKKTATTTTTTQAPQATSPHADASKQFEEAPPADLGPATYVAEGDTPAKHVEKYYQAYKDQKWEEAYNLQPAASKARETLEAYTESHKTMPLTTFTVSSPKESGDTQTIEASLDLGGSGGGMKWVTLWTFTKDGDKWIADKTQSGISQ